SMTELSPNRVDRPARAPQGSFLITIGANASFQDACSTTSCRPLQRASDRMIKIATWNVNSLKVRLPQVLDWLAADPVDVLCLQETKLRDEQFPKDAIAEAGYEAAFAGQPTYNGVAILTRRD